MIHVRFVLLVKSRILMILEFLHDHFWKKSNNSVDYGPDDATK